MTFLVTGATGNVGRHVVNALVAGGRPVRALTRSPETARLPGGAAVVRGDHSDPAVLDEALDGVDGVFLVWPFPSTAPVPAVVDTIARHARRVVLLSSLAVRDDVEEQTDPIGALHAALERPIERSALEWTFLRPGGFAVNTLAWAPEIRASGTVSDAFGEAAMPLIHEADIAAVAVRALTEDGHAGEKYTLTGADVMTQADFARIIGETIARPVHWQEIPRETARQRKIAQGLPPDIADVILDGYEAMVKTPASTTTTVEDLTGTRPRPFQEWARDHTGSFT
ncbi:NAD(P)H-binding protein [Actinomadura rugatobispora]|uniref:NAD(P)H-binding protein n=1 Tax=Actinomadura rugatobispora TaxID=1994 RepID=A0ABW1A0U2_9ACTN|nr:NAD(P)H-binding protein [Actinomadura rugatobispora]